MNAVEGQNKKDCKHMCQENWTTISGFMCNVSTFPKLER